MSNLSELILRLPSASSPSASFAASSSPSTPSAAKLHQAESWATQALGIIEKARGTPAGQPASHSEDICELALAATLFNLGMLREASLFPFLVAS